MALLACAQGTISVDTGIAHVAGATGRPTVVIFGWGSENKDIPCGPKVIALRGDPAGTPAYPLAPGDLTQAPHPWSASSSHLPRRTGLGGPPEPGPGVGRHGLCHTCLMPLRDRRHPSHA